MGSESRLITLVDSARRRAVGNLVCDQLTVGALASFGGAILLLLVGTQILDWYWLVVLFAGGAGISAWRTASRYPSAYSIAQTIDRRLGLSDAISTAYYFLTGSSRRVDPTVVEMQRIHAEGAAAGVDAATAMPLRLPRNFYPMLGMAAIVASLLAVRYGVKGNLDLKAPIVESVADFFFSNKEIQARNKQQPRRPGDNTDALATDRPDSETPELDQAPENALTPIEVPDTSQALDAPLAERAKQSEVKAGGDMSDESTDGTDESERGSGDQGKDGDAGSDKTEPAPDGSQKDAPKNMNKGAGGENSSLMDKMKDAMANLMSKLKIPQQAGQSKQGQSQQGGQKEGQKQEGGAGQKGEKGQGQQAKGASEDADADGQESEQQAQAGQGKSNEKGSEAGSPNEAKSGMGKQDGSKDLRDAQQMEAMGKLSEIFGKRAQQITGEVMVEVQSGKQQQLRTGYTQKGASHKEAGGEIHRDEIPAEFQHYVQQYFEQVRKNEAPVALAPPEAKR